MDKILRPVKTGDSYWTIGGIGICEWEWTGDEKDMKQSRSKNFFWEYKEARKALLKHFPKFIGRV